jgi:hypothetical protein
MVFSLLLVESDGVLYKMVVYVIKEEKEKGNHFKLPRYYYQRGTACCTTDQEPQPQYCTPLEEPTHETNMMH